MHTHNAITLHQNKSILFMRTIYLDGIVVYNIENHIHISVCIIIDCNSICAEHYIAKPCEIYLGNSLYTYMVHYISCKRRSMMRE